MAISEGNWLEARRDESAFNAANVLDILKQYRGETDASLARLVHMNPKTMWTYVRGVTRLDVGLIVVLSEILGVDPEVFFMTPDEALLWTINNRPNGPGGRSGRSKPTTGWFTHTERPAPLTLAIAA